MPKPRIPYTFKHIIEELADELAVQGDDLAKSLRMAVERGADKDELINLAKLNQQHALIERVVSLLEAGDVESADAAITKYRLRRQQNKE